MSEGCSKHGWASATEDCGQCGHAACAECLVRPFGPNKPPMCITCALGFAGVRKRGTQRPAPASSGRTRRFGRKERDHPVEAPTPGYVFDKSEPFSPAIPGS